MSALHQLQFTVRLTNWPPALDLAPMAKSPAFQLVNEPESDRPESLEIRWTGLDAPVQLDFPYDVTKSIG